MGYVKFDRRASETTASPSVAAAVKDHSGGYYMTPEQEHELWWYFLSNHRRFDRYYAGCHNACCTQVREEYREWLDSIVKTEVNKEAEG